MKRYLLSLLLLLPLCVFAEDEYLINGIEEPQWKDFAPPAFVDATEPKGINKFNDTNTYWYRRRMEFENGIEKCRSVQDNDQKISCYQALKVKQYQKNSDYNARLEAMEQQKMGPQEMFDRTTDMVPLGGFYDMMRFQPNELR